MSLALYRAYRPGQLSEVVGQDHVVAPLTRALETGRVHHAYLFSGPRGCGKTSTARILARSLNCEQGPTPEPCGVCDSCRGLAPNGPGTDDVIELDAASHGGVDDTRELRERIIYSPASSRYRVYIIDEAHMVTPQGFNALLKVIEEPPEYVRFIFATTEPEKVLGTIRSRTFNYNFRLVSAGVLSEHLGVVCRSEGVPFEPTALPLVAKAGGGSVRDALSILGQLIAGSGDDGLTHAYVASGLGLTNAVLLDSVIRAIAARDGAAAFAAVETVVESGHDGRRFLTDLLQRLRDLVVLRHVPAEQHASLLELPPDQVAGLVEQSALFGDAELSRAAELVSTGLSQLKGATAPRLQLELLIARLLLPEADEGEEGLAARLERLERQVAAGVIHQGGATSAGPPPRATGRGAAPAGEDLSRPDRADGPVAAAPASAERAPVESASAPPARPGTAALGKGGQRPRKAMPPKLSALAPTTSPGGATDPKQVAGPSKAEQGDSSAPEPAAVPDSSPPPEPQPRAAPARGQSAGPGLDRVQAAWPQILEAIGKRSRVAWTLWESSRPAALRNDELTVEVVDQGRLSSIRGARRDELLRQVLLDTLGLDVKVVPELAQARQDSAGPEREEGQASPDDPDLADGDSNGIDLVIREFGAVPIGEITES